MITAEVINEANVGVFYEALTLDSVEPSKTNPRKHFDKDDLEDLAKSIKEKGVIQPIVVRPHPKGSSKLLWEIIAGERRYRASKIAGAASIPAIARNLDDRAVLEIQVIENLQRVDIHPLDEALGYKELLEKHGYTAELLGEKVGKSDSYIYQRLKLAELIPAAKKLFSDDVITAGHAILIARLSPEEQKEVISDDGRLLWEYDHRVGGRTVVSVRSLAAGIKRELYLALSKAPWKSNDGKLLPSAGPCTNCPKRSGANPGLFAEITEKDICTDRKCYNLKVEAFIAREMKDGGMVKVSTDYGKKDVGPGTLKYGSYVDLSYRPDSCKYAQKAIVTEGRERGSSIKICSNKECLKHFPKFGSPGADSYQAKQRAKDQKRKIEMERRRRIFQAVLAAAPVKLNREDFNLIAKSAWKRQMGATQALILKAYEGFEPQKSSHGTEYDKPAFKFVDSAKDSELYEFMIATALGPELEIGTYETIGPAAILLAIAKRYNVNVDKINKEFSAELKVKAKKKPKVQTSAKSKSSPPDPDDDAEGDYDDPMEGDE